MPADRDPDLAGEMPGPLVGLRVVELASEQAAFAGKLLAGLGAEVTLVEPPGGAPMRWYEPFVDDVVDPQRSLWWWHYQAGKIGATVDLDDPAGAEEFRRLCASADVVLEGEPPGRLDALGLDAAQLRDGHDELIWVSVTPFGRDNPRAARAVRRPDRPRGRRPGVELRLRRPHATAGARRW